MAATGTGDAADTERNGTKEDQPPGRSSEMATVPVMPPPIPIEHGPTEHAEDAQRHGGSRDGTRRSPILLGAILLAAVLGIGAILAVVSNDRAGVAGAGPSSDADATTIAAVAAATDTSSTSAPTPTAAPTTAAAAAAPTSTSTRAIRTTTTRATTTTTSGDLGLAQEMSVPECDGSFVTFLGSVVEPSEYESEVSDLLRSYPNSSYMRTDVVGCTSLRLELDGDYIYAVYFGPFGTRRDALNACAAGPSGAYVKPLDNTWDSSETILCP